MPRHNAREGLRRAGRGLRAQASILQLHNRELRKRAAAIYESSERLLQAAQTGRAGPSLALLEGWPGRTSS